MGPVQKLKKIWEEFWNTGARQSRALKMRKASLSTDNFLEFEFKILFESPHPIQLIFTRPADLTYMWEARQSWSSF